jgi:hypothetical protein
LSFLFNTNRLNRLVEFQAENNGLGIDDMINILSSKTWKAPRLKGFKKLIQQQNEQLLTYLLAASINEASFATKSELLKAIDDLRTYATVQLKARHFLQRAFIAHIGKNEVSRKAKPTLHQVPPPGSPIGCGEE